MQDLWWLIVIYLVIFVFSVIAFILSFKHIVIYNRRPYFLLVELFAMVTWIIMAYLNVACLTVNFLGLVVLNIELLRITFMYQYLINQRGLMLRFCQLFWNRSRLRPLNACIWAIILSITRLAPPIIYYLLEDTGYFSYSCKDTYLNPLVGYVVIIPTYFTVMLHVIFVVLLYHKKAVDKIGLKFEFTCSAITFVLLTILTNSFREFRRYSLFWDIFAIALGSLVCYIWIPLFFVVKHDQRIKKINLAGCSYELDHLLDTSKELFCEETILFIKKYAEYKDFPTDELYQEIINTYIESAAPLELNISERMRNLAVSAPEGLEEVYRATLELVETNVLPYTIQNQC
eukprot:NODE_735_length_4708_cov_0.180122.p1 type:complete len:345 gc:universal NODE_735_length_4708_cov_0.180122:2238-3272(+)